MLHQTSVCIHHIAPQQLPGQCRNEALIEQQLLHHLEYSRQKGAYPEIR